MKLRNIFIALAITFTGLGFSACTDDSENIVPQPVDYEAASATVGNNTQDHGKM